jgi:hypothetical protein
MGIIRDSPLQDGVSYRCFCVPCGFSRKVYRNSIPAPNPMAGLRSLKRSSPARGLAVTGVFSIGSALCYGDDMNCLFVMSFS